MLWQFSSWKQPHVLQTSQKLRGALTPQEVFKPEERYEADLKARLGPQSAKHPGFSGHYLTLGQLTWPAGETQQEPPSGQQARSSAGCLVVQEASPGLDLPCRHQVNVAEIVGSLATTRRAFPHRSHRSRSAPLWFPLPPLMWDKVQRRWKGVRKSHIFIYIYIYDASKPRTLKKVFPPLTGCTRAWRV